ncbi:hypothetical protein JKP88DRAFT_254410 [Tribonema minus]|uniref:Choice-of-anchor I domain-containing protein n=1 Tax=Tribonema minus TaxID=303371 RepID=A0A836CHF6_9STRA|nr:hypothetical protein JKP88DRAFT_254410 [Tribonema minus]
MAWTALFMAVLAGADRLAHAAVCGNVGPKLVRVSGEYSKTPNSGLESAAYDKDSELWFATTNGNNGKSCSLCMTQATSDTGQMVCFICKFEQCKSSEHNHDKARLRSRAAGRVSASTSVPFLEVWNFADRALPRYVRTIDLSGSSPSPVAPTSVASKHGLLAVAINVNDGASPGLVQIGKPNVLGTSSALLVDVGYLPDMVTFTPNGTTVLVANEGERQSGFDPDGSITCIRLDNRGSRLTYTKSTATFRAADGVTIPLGVRIFPENHATPEKDIEPEYIAITADSKTAYVTLQENNAVAKLDVASCKVTDIFPLGTIDYSQVRFDPSDKNGIKLSTYDNPIVKGIFMPDTIGTFSVNGKPYFAIANEGDARSGEEQPAKILQQNTAEVKDTSRLEITLVDANGNAVPVAPATTVYSFGGRSMSIHDGTTGAQVFNSRDAIETLLAEPAYSAFYNSAHDKLDPDNRSEKKGPEPEGLLAAKVCGKQLVFVALERAGGVMVWDASNPTAAVCTDYVNSRVDAVGMARDAGPETIQLLPGDDLYEAYIAVPFEIGNHEHAPATGSGSFSIFGITC